MARCFIDSNVWLYGFILGEETNKSEIARTLIETHDPVVSTQVINEVCVNLIRRANFNEAEISQLIQSFYKRYEVILAIQMRCSA
jgi:predicted nucleic acid-binding protein